MKIKQITETSTTAGSIAPVQGVLGSTQTRGNPSIYGGKKVGNLFKGKTTSKPYANSLNEAAMKDLSYDLEVMKPAEFQKKYGKSREEVKAALSRQPKPAQPTTPPINEADLSEHDLIMVPGQGKKLKPGFISKADDRTDHEVEMARSDLFQSAKNAKKVYSMIKDVGEDEGLEGWVQEKIIKANDYLNTVREYLEGKQTQGVAEGGSVTHKGGEVSRKDGVTKHKAGPGVYGGYDASRHPDSPEEKHAGPRGAKAGHSSDKITKHQSVAEGSSNDMSTEDMIVYLRQHHDKNLHQDYLNHLTSTNSKFVLKNIPINSIRTELSGLDRAKVEQYKKMDFNKAPPIVVGSDGNILDGYHRATVAKALGIPAIKAYVGIKGQQGVAEGSGGNWYIRVNGKILNDTKFKPVIFSSEDEARSYAMKLADKKRIPLSQIKLTKSWMDAPEQGVAEGKRNLKCVCKTHGTMQCPVHTPKDIEVIEGAKVDRMVKHVAKSEKKLGHSKKEAENIAWATANKRGMLDNKNKKA